MLLRQRRSFVIDSRLALTFSGSALPAQTVRLPIPRIAPYGLEEIFVVVTYTIVATGIINGTNICKGFSLLNGIKRIQLGNIPNSDGKPSNIVDVSGAALLQFIANEGLKLDDATLATVSAVNRVRILPSGVYRVTYRIPLVHPFLTDGLRPRCLLPIFAFNQDPVLQLDFAADSEMTDLANPFASAAIEVFLVSREMQPNAIASINSTGGFINWDLLETPTNPAVSLSNVQTKIVLPTPGSYTGVLLYMQKGGATNNPPGDLSGSTTVGSETEWQLKGAGKDIIDSWRMKYLRILNDCSRSPGGPATTITETAAYTQATTANGIAGVPTFGGPLSTGFAVQEPSSVFLDFASDGLTDVRELGSLFNTKQYADKGLEVAIYGNITTAASATFPNVLSVVGRRLFGDLTTFQTLSGL